MPWKSTDAVEQRRLFVDACLKSRESIAAVARQFGISERVAHKFLRRFREEGPDGLLDRSRARHTQRFAAPDIEALVVEARHRFGWGPRKLRAYLAPRYPKLAWPAVSTIAAILDRHGLIVPRRRRRQRRERVAAPCVKATGPNRSWSIDFKGQFCTADGVMVYPLTVTDNFSRMILCCHALPSTKMEPMWERLLLCFREYGLPDSIRSDNGSPFGASNLVGLSSLAVRLLRLGIFPDFIAPASPQQNGRHERMHRTLKAETARPPAASMKAQQRRFLGFVKVFNEERPHEAIGDVPPASIHVRSKRELPARLPPAQYPDDIETRVVRRNGCFKWLSREVYISETLVGERIAFEQKYEDVYLVKFCEHEAAIFDVAKMKLRPVAKKAAEAAKSPKSPDLCARKKP